MSRNERTGHPSLVAAAALCLVLTGCAASSRSHIANPNEIVIGVAGPMSGNLDSFGRAERAGVERAVQDINAAGGVLGKQLYLQVGDDRCDPAKAKSVAQDMVDSHAAVVIGHFCSGAAIAAASVYGPRHMIEISMGSTNPRLTADAAASGWSTIFRVVNNNAQQGTFAAAWLSKKYPHGRIAVLDDGSSYSRSVIDPLIDGLKQTGISPTFTASYVSKSQDFTDLVGAVKRAKVDVVYIGGYHFDFAKILFQARGAGVSVPFIGTDALNTSEFPLQAQGTADGVRFADAAVLLTAPGAAKVADEIPNGVINSQGFALPSYAAVQAWAAGVQRAGTLDGAQVAAAMRSAPIDTVLGKLSWDSKGDLQQFRYAWFIWHGSDFSIDTEN